MKKPATTATPPVTTGAGTPWAVNRVQLVGRLAADPVTRDTTSGLVAKLRVVTNTGRTPEFHDVTVWGQQAADCANSLGKGIAVTITGRLRTRTWSAADGSSRRATEVVADNLEPFTIPA